MILKREKDDILEGFRSVQDFLLHCHDPYRKIKETSEAAPVPSSLSNEVIPTDSLQNFKKFSLPRKPTIDEESSNLHINHKFFYEKNNKLIYPPLPSEIKYVPIST